VRLDGSFWRNQYGLNVDRHAGARLEKQEAAELFAGTPERRAALERDWADVTAMVEAMADPRLRSSAKPISRSTAKNSAGGGGAGLPSRAARRPARTHRADDALGRGARHRLSGAELGPRARGPSLSRLRQALGTRLPGAGLCQSHDDHRRTARAHHHRDRAGQQALARAGIEPGISRPPSRRAKWCANICCISSPRTTARRNTARRSRRARPRPGCSITSTTSTRISKCSPDLRRESAARAGHLRLSPSARRPRHRLAAAVAPLPKWMGYFWDAFAIVAYFALVIGVGLASARHRGDNMREFSVGSRQLPWWAVLASIVAAELSAATFLGTPAEGYHCATSSTRNWPSAPSSRGSSSPISLSGPFTTTTSSRFTNFSRFGSASRRATPPAPSSWSRGSWPAARGSTSRRSSSSLGYEMIHGVAATNEQAVWIYGGAVLLVTALTTVYTAAGGIRAVVWTDVIQATVMGGAVIYALVSLWFGVGGWAGAHSVLNQPHDLKIFSTAASISLRPRLRDRDVVMAIRLSAAFSAANTRSGPRCSAPFSPPWPRTAPTRTWCSGC
jgi:hypothetical protein